LEKEIKVYPVKFGVAKKRSVVNWGRNRNPRLPIKIIAKKRGFHKKAFFVAKSEKDARINIPFWNIPIRNI